MFLLAFQFIIGRSLYFNLILLDKTSLCHFHLISTFYYYEEEEEADREEV